MGSDEQGLTLGDGPLAQTFARVRARNPYLRVQVGELDGQVTAPLRALVAQESPEREAHFAIMTAQYKTNDAEVLVRAYVGCLVYAVASAAVAAYVVDQRLPVLDLPELRVVMGEWGTAEALVLPGTRFWCLPEDPAATHPDAVPLADTLALRALLHERLLQLCTPLIAAMRPRARIGARALWMSVAETCASILVDALPAGTSEAGAEVAVQELVGGASELLRARPEVIMLRSGDAQRLALLGRDCCVNFRIPGESYCTTCPHRPRQERIDALLAWFAEQAAAPVAAGAA